MCVYLVVPAIPPDIAVGSALGPCASGGGSICHGNSEGKKGNESQQRHTEPSTSVTLGPTVAHEYSDKNPMGRGRYIDT